MRSTILVLFASLIATPQFFGQGPPAPAPELARYDRLIGNWTGSGTSTNAPGEESHPWTCKSTVKKSFGGHVLTEDVLVDLGENVPFQFAFRNLYGYDRERQRYLSISAGNMGPPKESVIHWADDNTMISTEFSIEEGHVMSDRWVTVIGKDVIEFAGHRTIGGGKPFVHVQGRMTRSGKDDLYELDFATPSMLGAPSEMARLARMAGTYRLDGTYQPGPDIPAFEIGGVETFRSIFGGLLIEGTVAGDEMPGQGSYESWAAFGWNPEMKHYTVVYANNMGEIGSYEGRWVEDQFVTVGAHPMMGMPAVTRSVMTFDDKGALTHSAGHAIMGSGKPFKMFEAKFVRK